MNSNPLRHGLLPALLAIGLLALAYVAMWVNSDLERGAQPPPRPSPTTHTSHWRKSTASLPATRRY